jgi:hypothetical protein
MMLEIKFDGRDLQMGDSLNVLHNGNLRRWIVCGWNDDKSSIVLESVWGFGM